MAPVAFGIYFIITDHVNDPGACDLDDAVCF